MSRTVNPDGFDAYFRAWEAKVGAFLEYKSEGAGHSQTPVASSALAGLPFAVKDNIAVEGFGLSCGSKLLEGFRSPYTATAVGRLEAAGATVVGKTNMDEFGMGSSTDSSALKVTNNPWDASRVAGGSSGGSAAAVAAGLVPFALGSDTGGSVRQPAAFCGVVGLKPTYGAVSRYGLVAYASSLETVGVVADTVPRARAVFAAMRGLDPMDQTTEAVPADSPPLRVLDGAPAAPRRIGVLSPAAVARAIAAASVGAGSADAGEAEAATSAEATATAAAAAALEPEVAAGFELAVSRLRELGHELVEIDLPSLKYGVPAYYTIATAEASANLARFDGIRYGNRPEWAENPDDLIDKSRGAGFGDEVKLRILLGTFVLRSGFQDRYYLRAQRIRAGIRRDFDRVLSKVDAVLMPVFPTRAFGRGDAGLSPFAQKAADLYTCCANLAGLPALSFPASVEGGLPVGVQLVGRAFAEGTLLDVAEGYESKYPAARPAGYTAFWR
jgi:aspartyl-tRNA(Asn)/glutamyl-tRNA(Gln) amidotransferase subunit A